VDGSKITVRTGWDLIDMKEYSVEYLMSVGFSTGFALEDHQAT